MRFVRSRSGLMDLSIPRIMGILNITPDSFYDGGKFNAVDQALQHTEQMLEEGMDILDIGGMSTRPGAEHISPTEEIERVKPIIKAIRSEYEDLTISIDTVHAEVVRTAAALGVDWINDISAGRLDEHMLDAVAESGLPYILMHMQGRPDSMQYDPRYEHVIRDVLDFFVGKMKILRKHNIKDVIIDPGFGFGKTVEHNYDLLTHLDVFRQFERPILVGLSRKSMVTKALGIKAEEALHGTGVLNFAALQGGANILRVHDVRQARQVIDLFDIYRKRLNTGDSMVLENNSKA